ncbi:hypothetical protein EYZ11_006518 [Aspergillus tanneri]|uniref:Reverse transcriptase domain-containing protein n=1 Tax=Aspergillus tanneri TaxID=1220188 RepID=A0A4S3JFA9_9EURO|nr:hypothetical protein EYZ11_006518 [Aspergillus tanneri]
MTLGYVDDICILVWGTTVRENYTCLCRLHTHAEHWERTHASKFSLSKYSLINMPTSELRYLGVFLDPNLSGKAHLKQLQAKAVKLTAALSSIAGLTWALRMATDRACLQIMFSPFHQTLRTIRNNAPTTRRTYIERDPALSPLHRLERRVAQALEEDLEQFSVETIQPVVVPPCGYKGGIGASAVITARQESLYQPVGQETTHTVYTGELMGIDMALALATPTNCDAASNNIVILFNNQAAIRACAKPAR